MKLIPLPGGMATMVDDEDFPRLASRRWHLQSKGYVQRGDNRVLMHRFILDAPAGVVVDHINHDKLDNRRANIRLCTRSQNMQNMIGWKSASSRFKGVHWSKSDQRWIMRIRLPDGTRPTRFFRLEEDAARAYDALAREHFGEFALTNY